MDESKKLEIIADVQRVLKDLPDMSTEDRTKFFRSNFLFDLFIRAEDIISASTEISNADKGRIKSGFAEIRKNGRQNIPYLGAFDVLQLVLYFLNVDYSDGHIEEFESYIRNFKNRLRELRLNTSANASLSNTPVANSPDPINEYYKTNTSYSGADMVCSINVPGKGPVIFGELSQLSYSVFREKVPVRAIGHVRMKGYTRGMRTVTGILGFTMFDESAVYQAMKDIRAAGYRLLMDEMPTFDITITFANEYGSRSKMTIFGVSTFTEGMVLSVNDMYTQNVYEFYALDINPMERMEE